MRYHKNVQNIFLTLLIIVLTSQFTHAASEDTAQHSQEKQNFNPAEFILSHVTDNYKWHIFTTPDGTHVSLHLPVILYTNDSGLQIFSSSKLSHGKSYNGCYVAQEAPNKGKIVKKLPDGETIKPLDLSITKNVLSIFINSLLLIIIFVSVAKEYNKRKNRSPKGLQNALEPLITFIRDDVAKANIGEEKYEKFTPFLLSVFFFILLNNLMGIIPIFPGGTNLTGNLYITAVLAFFTFVITTVSANKYYWRDIVNTPSVPWWLKFPIPLMPIIEFSQVFIKPTILAIRLFANILAGHIIILSFISLIFIFGNIDYLLGYGVSVVSIVFSVFMTLLEILVAFIQAYVFTILSAMYFGMATETE